MHRRVAGAALWLAAILTSGMSAAARTDRVFPAGTANGSDLLGDLGRILAPSRVDTSEWSVLSLGALGTVAILPHDVAIYRHIRDRWPNPTIRDRRAGEYVSVLGAGEFDVSVCLAMFAVGGERERRAAIAGIESLAATALVVSILKYATGVPRPSDSPNRREWTRVSWRNDAFPSGHTATAFAVASVLGEAYGATWPAYAAAVLVGLGRIAQGTHWPSDVIAGAAIGIVLGRRAASLHDLGWEIRVAPDRSTTRIELAKRF